MGMSRQSQERGAQGQPLRARHQPRLRRHGRPLRRGGDPRPHAPPPLNEAIWRHLRLLNERPFKKLAGSRASVFAELEAPLLAALPAEPYLYRRRKRARVHIGLDPF